MQKSVRAWTASIVMAMAVSSMPLLAQTTTSSAGGGQLPTSVDASVSVPPEVRVQLPGRNASSSSGVAGERQSPGLTPGSADPYAKISTRISNRVENRIRNRIDRYYDPLANATSPYAVAAEQARRTPAGNK